VTDPTVKFLIFAAISALGLVGGYTARRRRWLAERRSRHIHLFTIVFIWSPVCLRSFWRLDVDFELAQIMLLQPLFMLVGWAAVSIVGRAMKLPVAHRGVLVLCAALSNQGITLGAYLCFVLLKPGPEAMDYALAYVISMMLFMVVIFYPVAHIYQLNASRTSPDDQAFSYPRLLRESFVSLRAAPMYMAITGTVLSKLDVAMPEVMNDTLLVDAYLLAGSFGAYFGNAMTLRLGDTAAYVRHHIALTVVKFMIVPGVTAAVLLVILPALGMGLSALPLRVLMLSAFMPSAMNSVIVSNLFHLDARMASSLWLTNTMVFCLVPLPIILLVL
jgi:predicted permease